MLRRALVALLLLLTAFAAAQGGAFQSTVAGNNAANPDLTGVSIEPLMGARPPFDVALKDDAGRETNLGRLLHGRPIVLLPIFYRCNGVCTTEMQGVLNALAKNPKLRPGKDLDVVVLGLNPKETPDLAAAKKAEYVSQYGHPETKDGWIFLTGPQAPTTQITNALGVHYTYDAAQDRVNHPSAVLVLTPEGRVSSVMTQGMYPAARFAEDVARAGREEIGEKPSDTSWLGCVHTDPITGKRSLAVQGVVRLFAVLVVVGILVSMVFLSLKRGKGQGDRPTADFPKPEGL